MPKPVTLVGALCGRYSRAIFAYLLEAYNETRPRSNDARIRGRPEPGSLASAATGGIYPEAEANIELITKHCGQLQWFVERMGAIPEPTWRGIGQVADFCGEVGREWFHRISSGDRRYDPAETEDKMVRRAEGSGPFLCTTFEGSSPHAAKICAACPHRGNIKSPIALGYRRMEEAPPKLEELGETEKVASQVDTLAVTSAVEADTQTASPSPIDMCKKYNIDSYGRVSVTEELGKNGKASKPEPFLETPVEVIAITKNEWDGKEAIVVRFRRPNSKRWESATIEYEELGHNVRQKMLAKGIITRHAEHFRMYIDDQLATLHYERRSALETSYRSFGLKRDGFLYAGKLYSATGVHDARVSTDVDDLSKYMLPRAEASLEVWSKLVATFFRRGMETHVLTILACAAGPLMVYMSSMEGGGIVHTWSEESGKGKTTSLFAGLSVYGRKALNIMERDTLNSRYAVMRIMGGMTIVFNELPVDESAVDLVKAFDTGEDKKRLDQTGMHIRRSKGYWNTMFVSNANKSLFDYLRSNPSTVPQSWRVMEFHADLIPEARLWEGDLMREEFERHAGTAGHALMKHIYCTTGKSLEVESRLKAKLKELTLRTKWPQQARYWLRMLTAMTIIGEIMYELKLIPEAPHKYIDWAIMRQEDNVDQVVIVDKHIQASTHLLTILNELRAYTLFVKGGDVMNGHASVYPVPGRDPRGPIYVRKEEHTGLVYVESKAFKKAARDHIGNYRKLRLDLMEQNIITRELSYDLGHGTVYSLGIAPCLEINLRHPSLTMEAPDEDGGRPEEDTLSGAEGLHPRIH